MNQQSEIIRYNKIIEIMEGLIKQEEYIMDQYTLKKDKTITPERYWQAVYLFRVLNKILEESKND